ncbi:cadherin-related family member 5 [Engystomops pustulosus]|uniref:cadherin-related family member 5 n=1 Tax=Engystomops pustulosus TaxID=76066 RepID=UPI003AFB5FBE
MGPLFALCILFLIPVGCLSQGCRSENQTPAIREDAEPGTVVTPLIIEPDHEAEVNTPKFGINGTNLILTEKLDYEKEKLTSVNIFCRRNGTPVTGQTIYVEIINVNDNAPVFKQSIYNFTVLESHPVNSPIGTLIEAEDADGDTLYYELVGDNMNALGYLRLSSPTLPQLLLSKSLDYDLDPHLWLNITARDTQNPADHPSFTATTSISITIMDADDKPPFFQPCTAMGTKICINNGYRSMVNRSETAVGPLQLIPGPLYAVDGDYGINDPVAYTIISGNVNEAFNISDTTGNITMNKAIDSLGTILLQVMAYQTNDILKNSITNVQIDVKEKNNFPPRFPEANYYGTISSISGIGSFVLDSSDQTKQLLVFASDADFPDGYNPAVTYKIENSTDFRILRDGYILSNSVFTSPGTAVLLVNATDSTTSESTTTTVTIEITPAPTTTTTTTTTTTITTVTSTTTAPTPSTGTTTTTTPGTGTTTTTTPSTGTTPTIPPGTGTTTTTTPSTGTTTTTTPGTGTTTTTTPSTGTTTTTTPGTGTTTTTTPSTGTTTTTTPGTGTTTTTTPSTGTTTTTTPGTGTTTTTTPSTGTTTTTTPGTGTTTTTTPSTGTTTTTTPGTGTTTTTTPSTGTTTTTTPGTGTTTTTTPSTGTTTTTTPGTGTTTTTSPSTGTTTSATPAKGTTPTPGTTTTTTTGTGTTTTITPYTGTITSTTPGTGTTRAPSTQTTGSTTPKIGTNTITTPSTHTTTSNTPGTGTTTTTTSSAQTSTRNTPGTGSGEASANAANYTATDMAILGATLGSVLALCLVGLAFFIYKQYGNSIKWRLQRGNNSGGSGDRIDKLISEEDNMSIAPPSISEPDTAGYIEEVSSGNNLMAAAAVSPVLFTAAPAESQPSAEPDGESDSDDKKMKSILTKDLKENAGYKAVWFREDAAPEVMVIEDTNVEANEDSEEEFNNEQGDDEEEEDEEDLNPTFAPTNNDSSNLSML